MATRRRKHRGNDHRRRRRRRKRNKEYLPRKRFLGISKKKLRSKFRVNRKMFKELEDLMRPTLERKTACGKAIPLDTAVLSCLRLLATGSFQSVVADVGGISQASVSRIFDQFCNVLNDAADKFIKFPLDDQGWLRNTADCFETKSGFPGVVGIVDGVHVEIKKPAVNGQIYLNRKSRPTINVQIVSGFYGEILDVVAKWPGSTHDATIWRLSAVKDVIEEILQQTEFHILGDSAYPESVNLLTPIKGELNAEESAYNLIHSRTRVSGEDVYGRLKMTFRIIDSTGGRLLYTPEKVAKIIIACCCLHNMRLQHKYGEDLFKTSGEAPILNGAAFGNETAAQKRHRLMQSFA